MGNRDATTKMDRSLGPRVSKTKPSRPSIQIDTSSDEFPDLPAQNTKPKSPPSVKQSISTLTQDNTELQSIKHQLDLLTKSHEAILAMQQQLQQQIANQNRILDLLTQQNTQPQSSSSPSQPTTPPIETPPTPQETTDLIGLDDYMTDSTPGENKRSPPSPQTDSDLVVFSKLTNALDEQIRLANKDDAHQLRQKKHLLVSYQKATTKLYNETFHQAQWIVASSKKTRAQRVSSLKPASNEIGHASQQS